MPILREDAMYFLGIPIPPEIGLRLYELIHSISKKEKMNFTNKQVKNEFHITLGVFRPGKFKTNRELFYKIINALNTNKTLYRRLTLLFRMQQQCIITGIGHIPTDEIKTADVIYASAQIDKIKDIRNQIEYALAQLLNQTLNITNAQEILPKYFSHTTPHITLVKITRDIHGIEKPQLKQIQNYDYDPISFISESVCLYESSGGENHSIATFGPADYDGNIEVTYEDYILVNK